MPYPRSTPTSSSSSFTSFSSVVYGTSPTKTDFCAAFDPDGEFINLPCYYGNGFNCALVAAIFSALSSLLLWFYVSPDFSASVYEFKTGGGGSSGGYGDVSAPLDSASSTGGGASISASFQGSSSVGASAYQGFGSAEI